MNNESSDKPKNVLKAAKFVCTACDKSFQWKSGLSRHFKLFHLKNQEKTYKCEICDKRFYKQVGLSMHLKQHRHTNSFSMKTPRKSIPTAFCKTMKTHRGISIKNNQKISHLYANIVSETVYSSDSDCEYEILQTATKLNNPDAKSENKCQFCEKNFVKSSSLQRHSKKHNKTQDLNLHKENPSTEHSNLEFGEVQENEKIYSCNKCNKTFKLASNLANHLKMHLKQSIVARKELTTNTFQQIKPRYSCSLCKKFYLKTVHLDNHLAMHNSTDQEYNQSECPKNEINTNMTLVKPYLCMVCGKGYSRASYLSIHMRTHSNYRPHLCSVCGKSFTVKRYLIIHSRTHTHERPFKCQHCNKGFIQKGNLIEHLRIHSGVKPHICAVCGKQFTHYSGLTQHLLTHNPVKSHVCKICGKGFRQGGHYREHMRIHSGDRPFICNICDRSFASSSSLVVHSRTHSGERPYKCLVCQKGFIKSYGLKQHKKTHTACNIPEIKTDFLQMVWEQISGFAMFKGVSELCDVVSHVIVCPEDSSVMVTLEPNANEYWIPSAKVINGSSWCAQSATETEDIFGSTISSLKLLRLYKIATPQGNSSFIYHCIYELVINSDLKKKSKNTNGKYRGKIRWVQEPEIVKMLTQENLRSPEILELFRIIKGGGQFMLTDGAEISAPAEFVYAGNCVEIADRILVSSTYDGIYQQLIESASFTKEIQMAIFKEFVFVCFPAMYMCQQAFSRFCMQLGWSRDDGPFIFKAADINSRYGLSYRDFLYVLAAMEPTTSHGGSPAELRCRYIFRFFDRDRDNVLNYGEFKNLIMTVRKIKKQPIDAVNVAKDAEACFKNIGLNPDTNSLSMAEFLRAVGDLKLRGTSQIFRSTTSVIQYLQDLQERENKAQQKMPKAAAKFENKLMKPFMKDSTVAIKKSPNKNTDYALGGHTIRLQKSGTLISIDEIWNVGTAVSLSSTRQHTLTDSSKRQSQDQFNQTSVSNEILKSLRYLMQLNKTKATKASKNKEPYNWGQLDNVIFAKNLITICNQVKEHFRAEPRMIEIQAPVYIMGDLHGNIVSLLFFEKVLWHLGPGLCPCNLLFLGDYVDRGPFSIEVISYLFCYKVQTPGKLLMLRGNHEIREIQKLFTFYTECVTKFGEKLGTEVWNGINNAFDTMPIAASVDGKIFCCHGGIPPPWLCPTVAAINSIPCPLNNPDEQSSLAWEIMWNDPISKQKQISEEVALELLANDGFAINRRRGTAHIFSVEALERFLNTNGFSHIIRAHEVAQAGFNVLLNAKLLTVFSSSKYCGGANEAACVLADQGKLRVLRLEPS